MAKRILSKQPVLFTGEEFAHCWRALGNMRAIYLFLVCVLCVVLAGCGGDWYECVERTEKENVPSLFGSGSHTEVDYVLLHEGHKIYATCSYEDFVSFDPKACCGFRVLGKYRCTSGQEGSKQLSWDLKCTADLGNVYLYATKKE